MEERLQKVIANAGYTSRRNAEKLILAGKVLVNGKVVRELGIKVSNKDEIIVEGNLLQKDEKVYYLLNKPRGVVSTSTDDKGRKTVTDIIDCDDRRIYPVGRLDYDTTGVLILTNDGELTNILTHPRCLVPKTYLAKLNRCIEMEDFYAIKEGVSVDGKVVNVTHLKLKKQDKKNDTCFVELTITEGRNHIVKKLFQSRGYLVDKLTRTSYASLTVGTLLSGEYRTLTKKEVSDLYMYKKGKRK